MLLPEPMSRVLVVGTKQRLPDTIDILYSLENVHIIDFPADVEGFSLGSPMDAASDASGKLLKLRSVEKDLNIDEKKQVEQVPISKIENNLDATIAELESEVKDTIELRHAKQAQLADLEDKLVQLEPFTSIPLGLEMYRGYTSLKVMAGNIRTNPDSALSEVMSGHYELFTSEKGTFIVLFVSTKQAEEAQRILGQNGFVQVSIPEGEGIPQTIGAALENDIAAVKREIGEINDKIAELSDRHASMVLASDEHLSIKVEKAELPLRMGASAHSFILEAWIPTDSYDQLDQALTAKFGDAVHFELLENRGRADDEASVEESADDETDVADEAPLSLGEETPVKLEHGRNAGHFEFFTKLLSTPRYNEVDPTITVAIFFPMFFGLMVGDVGYGIPFVVLGFLGLRMCTSKDWRAIATMLFYGGIWSIFFGLFLFGDMMGIEFTAPAGHAAGLVPGWETPTWATLLGIDIPHTLFSIGNFDVNLGYYTKLGSVEPLLYMSLWIGIAHLLTGLALGFYNVAIRHGLKQAIMEKLSWILIMVGFACLLPVAIDILIRGHDIDFTNPLLMTGIGLFAVGVIMALGGVGGMAIVELPEVMSNVLSYTRLIAVGMSKAGMALAFNYISLGMIVGIGMENMDPTTNIVMLISALLIFTVGHLAIFILAILSAGLHGIRLQYVELFKKFYEGGGLEFNPLKIKRRYTVEE
mgnify:CR=1 FL=1